MASYISKVKLPNDTTVYDIKDAWAWEQIDKLSNATHFLGKTTTVLTDGGTTASIVIGTDTYAVAPTGSQKQLNNGDIVVTAGEALDGSDEGTEFICAIPGEGSAAITWYKFGSARLNELGSLAYKNNVGLTGSVTTANTYTGAAGTYPVVLSTTAVTGATSFKAVNTVGNYDKTTSVTYDKMNTGKYLKTTKVSYSKATSGAATVNSSATFTGTIDAVKSVGTTKNTATSLALYSVTSGGVNLVTAIPSTATATGASANVGSATVYGLAASTTKYMTGAESLSKVSLAALTGVTVSTATTTAKNINMSVNNEILTFTTANAGVTVSLSTTSASALSYTTGITAGTSATATTYTVGKSGAATMTQPTVTIGAATTVGYKVSVPASTWAIAATGTTEAIDVEVTGSAVTDGAVTITNTAADATITTASTAITDIGYSATAATISTTATAVPVTTSTFYGKTTVASASHNHTVNNTLAVTTS